MDLETQNYLYNELSDKTGGCKVLTEFQVRLWYDMDIVFSF